MMQFKRMNELASYTRLKNMVKKYLDQETKDRIFDARNDRTASVRRKGDDRSKSEDRKQRDCTHRLQKKKDRAPQETHAVDMT